MLRLYHDEAGLREVTQNDPDLIKDAVYAGGSLTRISELYVKSDDSALTYENISLTAIGDENTANQSGEVDVTYSLDNVTFEQTLALPDGDYTTAQKVYRKVTAPNVSAAFKRLDIQHELSFDEYVK